MIMNAVFATCYLHKPNEQALHYPVVTGNLTAV